MLSKLKTLLVAGAVLPLATGFAFAQTTQPGTAPVANPSTPTAAAPALAPSTTAGKSTKDVGALKTTPAEKKAQHDKISGATTTTKTAALTSKHHAVKKHETAQKTGAMSSDAGKTSPVGKTDAVPAKKL